MSRIDDRLRELEIALPQPSGEPRISRLPGVTHLKFSRR
jgi:hypothetical protein